MGLAADIGFCRIALGVERVEVLLKPLICRDAGIYRTAGWLTNLHVRTTLDGLSRRPKNLGPFQRVPVMAKATLDRLGYLLSFQAKPSASTMTRCSWPSHSRTSRVPTFRSVLR